MSDQTPTDALKPSKDLAQPWKTLLAVPALFVRVLTLIPVLATMITSVALLFYGAKETLHFVHLIFPGADAHGESAGHNEILYVAIEIVDLFLLATVIQVVSLGLYQLYFNQDLKLPAWLKIRNLDDLKSKLVSVVITMLGVLFLGEILVWDNTTEIAFLGVGVAAIIAALVYFLNKIKVPH